MQVHLSALAGALQIRVLKLAPRNRRHPDAVAPSLAPLKATRPLTPSIRRALNERQERDAKENESERALVTQGGHERE